MSYGDTVMSLILNNIEDFNKKVGECDTYYKDIQAARVVRDLSEAYYYLMQAKELDLTMPPPDYYTKKGGNHGTEDHEKGFKDNHA